jgi:hypothetical protein
LVAASGDHEVLLRWIKVSDQDMLRYRIYGGNSPNPTSILDSTSGPLDTAKTLGGLQNNMVYYLRITAVDSLGSESDPSNEVFVEPALLTGIVQTEIRTSTGWSLVGLPNDVDNRSYRVLFPNAISGTLYEFAGTYVARDSLEISKGYWLRFASDSTVTLTGLDHSTSLISLVAGWNLIAGPSCAMPLSHAADPQSIVIPGTLYGFNGVYVPKDTLSPGSGYWLRAYVAGNISLGCADLDRPANEKLKKTPFDLKDYASLLLKDALGRSTTPFERCTGNNNDSLLYSRKAGYTCPSPLRVATGSAVGCF